jgi:hypothetical protein
MRALKLFYLVVCIYLLYYCAAMLYRLLGEDAIPIFVSVGILFILRGVVAYLLLKK